MALFKFIWKSFMKLVDIWNTEEHDKEMKIKGTFYCKVQ